MDLFTDELNCVAFDSSCGGLKALPVRSCYLVSAVMDEAAPLAPSGPPAVCRDSGQLRGVQPGTNPGSSVKTWCARTFLGGRAFLIPPSSVLHCGWGWGRRGIDDFHEASHKLSSRWSSSLTSSSCCSGQSMLRNSPQPHFKVVSTMYNMYNSTYFQQHLILGVKWGPYGHPLHWFN